MAQILGESAIVTTGLGPKLGLAGLLWLLATGPLRAGTITVKSLPATGTDAATGLNSASNYLCCLDFGNATAVGAINGVPFQHLAFPDTSTVSAGTETNHSVLFHALNEEEGIEGADAGAEIAQALHPHFNDEGQVAEHLAEHHAVITRAGPGDGGVFIGMIGPRELAAIHDDAADGGAVAAQKLGGRVDHDIGAVLDRAAEIRRSHGVIDNQRHAGFVGDGRNLFDIQHVHARIGDGLAVDRARLGCDRALRKFSGSSGSTNFTSIPNRRKLTSNCV